jgi:hypothetical protein
MLKNVWVHLRSDSILKSITLIKLMYVIPVVSSSEYSNNKSDRFFGLFAILLLLLLLLLFVAWRRPSLLRLFVILISLANKGDSLTKLLLFKEWVDLLLLGSVNTISSELNALLLKLLLLIIL